MLHIQLKPSVLFSLADTIPKPLPPHPPGVIPYYLF